MAFTRETDKEQREREEKEREERNRRDNKQTARPKRELMDAESIRLAQEPGTPENIAWHAVTSPLATASVAPPTVVEEPPPPPPPTEGTDAPTSSHRK